MEFQPPVGIAPPMVIFAGCPAQKLRTVAAWPLGAATVGWDASEKVR